MRPYSQDLRERAIAALAAGHETQAQVAAQFRIHKSTLEKWWYRWRDTGSCAALPSGRGPGRTLQASEAVIRAAVKQQPDMTLAELCERVAAAHGVAASPSMMCRTLQVLALPRKKRRSTTASGRRHA
jgi:transposase